MSEVTVCFSRLFLYLPAVKLCQLSYSQMQQSWLRWYTYSLDIKKIEYHDIHDQFIIRTEILLCVSKRLIQCWLPKFSSSLANCNNVINYRDKLVLTWLADTRSDLIKNVTEVASAISISRIIKYQLTSKISIRDKNFLRECFV